MGTGRAYGGGGARTGAAIGDGRSGTAHAGSDGAVTARTRATTGTARDRTRRTTGTRTGTGRTARAGALAAASTLLVLNSPGSGQLLSPLQTMRPVLVCLFLYLNTDGATAETLLVHLSVGLFGILWTVILQEGKTLTTGSTPRNVTPVHTAVPANNRRVRACAR